MITATNRAGAIYAAVLLAFLTHPPETRAASSPISVAHDLDAEWAIVGSATTHGEGARFQSGAEQSSDIRYLFSPQVTSRLLLHFGAEWQRFSFDTPNAAPIPNTFDGISAVLGLDWQVSDRWLFRGQVQPGVYTDFHDVSWNAVDAPFLLSAAYLVNPDLQWVFGLRVDPRSRYPVIPALGVRWKFSDQWTLDALLPRPRLEYDLAQTVQLHLGATFKAGTFRVGDPRGNDGEEKLFGGVLDYFEVRAGPGVSWEVRPNIKIEADAGYMLYRFFEFSDHDRVLRSDPAPYFHIACQFRF